MRYLGVDFGLRRIGLAQSEGELSSPLKTIEVRNLDDAVSQVEMIFKKEQFGKVIVGLPEGKIGNAVKRFINKLKKRGIDTISVDETFSTKIALDEMIKFGIGKKDRKITDAYSAAIILQNYLDSL